MIMFGTKGASGGKIEGVDVAEKERHKRYLERLREKRKGQQ